MDFNVGRGPMDDMADESFQAFNTEVGALFLLVSWARMRILLSLPSKSKTPTSVERVNLNRECSLWKKSLEKMIFKGSYSS